MRTFNYSKISEQKWDSELLGLIAAIYKEAGKQEMYLKQRPEELEKLVEIAKVQSTESSNAIEGIVTTNTRIRQIVEDKTTPKNCPNGQIIDLYGGFLIIPYFVRRATSDFKMIGKRTFNLTRPVTVTCYSQGGVKLCTQKDNDFLIEGLPFIPKDVKFECCSFSGKEYFILDRTHRHIKFPDKIAIFHPFGKQEEQPYLINRHLAYHLQHLYCI